MVNLSTSKFLTWALASRFYKRPSTTLQDFSGHLPTRQLDKGNANRRLTFIGAELLGLGATTHGVVEASEWDASLSGDDGLEVVHGS